MAKWQKDRDGRSFKLQGQCVRASTGDDDTYICLGLNLRAVFPTQEQSSAVRSRSRSVPANLGTRSPNFTFQTMISHESHAAFQMLRRPRGCLLIKTKPVLATGRFPSLDCVLVRRGGSGRGYRCAGWSIWCRIRLGGGPPLLS